MSLFSKGGKVQYLCPECRSPDVARFAFAGLKVIVCTSCSAWYQWSSRIRQSVKKSKNKSDDAVYIDVNTQSNVTE